MTEGEIRIVLAGILLIYDGKCNQIKYKTGIFSEPFEQQLRKMVLIQNILDDDVRANPETAAPVSLFTFFWKNGISKEILEFFLLKIV